MKERLRQIRERLTGEIIYLRLAIKTRFSYMRRSFTGNQTIPPKGEYCELTVVAFNNATVIDYQIRLLKKYFATTFRYTVFDNSTNSDISKEIQAICKRAEVGYVKLPIQSFIPKGFGSYSHGIACNYIYDNFVSKSHATYWGLLDHDIFPVSTFDLRKHLNVLPYYGVKNGKYLWPGFLFIRTDYLRGKKVDFRPSLHLHGDTGIRNARTLFPELDSQREYLAKEEKKTPKGSVDFLSDGYSTYDCNWIHFWNTSGYHKKDKAKKKLIGLYNMLDKLIDSDKAEPISQ